jgi:hypothetical protein
MEDFESRLSRLVAENEKKKNYTKKQIQRNLEAYHRTQAYIRNQFDRDKGNLSKSHKPIAGYTRMTIYLVREGQIVSVERLVPIPLKRLPDPHHYSKDRSPCDFHAWSRSLNL